MKRLYAVVLAIALFLPFLKLTANADSAVSAVSVTEALPFELDCASAVLMDYSTGTVLYNKNGAEALPPASVTKIMTLLLVMEAIDSGKMKYTDTLQVSEYAASMGGSQVYLEPGEEMTVEDLIKSVVISSANDAAVTLAEAVAGSETAFITMMNEKSKELGMNNTNFENATGLDDTVTNHVTSALDIAIMSRELMRHPDILKYSSIWMDSIRDGAFGLTNTNRLVRFYSGATGLKTGSTSKAKFCISATAKRGDLHLIAVIMGAPSRDVRNEAAKALLDYGFANFAIYSDKESNAGKIKVTGSAEQYISLAKEPFCALISKSDAGIIKARVKLPDSVSAPVKAGDAVGKVIYYANKREIGRVDIKAETDAPEIGFFELLSRILSSFCFS